MIQSADKKYYPELDGLRGLAALMVFFSHAIVFAATSLLLELVRQTPLPIFWDGAAAVDLFFVLSGFVLSLPFVSGKKDLDYPSYVIRRMFRLYPAFWLAIVLSLSLRWLSSPLVMVDLSAWAQSFWTANDPVNWQLIASHIPLLFSVNTKAIDPVTWTLITEMRMSLLLPIFIYCLLRVQGLFGQTCLVIGMFMFSAFTGKMGAFPLFALGAYLASNLNYFSLLASKLSKKYLLALLLVTFCLYGNRWILPFHLYQSYLTGISAFFLILVAINVNALKSILTSKLFIFLGKTSYSFYLFHLPVLVVITSVLYKTSHSLWLCALVALLISYALAMFCYTWVEVPMVQWGKCLTVRKMLKGTTSC